MTHEEEVLGPASVPEVPADHVRVVLMVEYDGRGFVGLQRQGKGLSIQSAIEDAAGQLGSKAAGFRASGRTDAGVHARGQVVALNVPAAIGGKALAAMNWHLPETIRVRRMAFAAPGFDPRRHAIRRSYRYLLCAGQPMPATMVGRMGKAKARVNLELMQEASREFMGQHDFRAWRSAQCQAKRTLLTITRLEVRPWSDAAPHGMDSQCFEIVVECRSFLHHMVRYLVGGLVQAGRGELNAEQLRGHLDAMTLPLRTAPADAFGLSLERVDYPAEWDPFRDAE